MSVFYEILRIIVVPIIIGLLTIYFKDYLDRQKEKRQVIKDAERELKALETHYFKMRSHFTTLQSLVNESNTNFKKCDEEVKSIFNYLNEIDMEILPRDLKSSCGYLRHAFKMRITEIETISKSEYITDDIYKYGSQLSGTVAIMDDKYIKPLRKYVEPKKSIQN